MNYARRVLGWRIFYVDSNTVATSFADGKPHPIPAAVFAKLSETFPDCLFITEFAGEGYDDVPSVTPWRPFADGSPDVPPGRGVLALRPLTKLEAGTEERAKILAAFRGGCLPMLPVDRPGADTWGPMVMELYREATGAKPKKQQ